MPGRAQNKVGVVLQAFPADHETRLFKDLVAEVMAFRFRERSGQVVRKALLISISKQAGKHPGVNVLHRAYDRWWQISA